MAAGWLGWLEVVDVVVVAALLGVGVGDFDPYQGVCVGSRKDSTRAQLGKVSAAVTIYAAERDYPEDLDDLVEAKLARPKQLVDVWKHPLVYHYPPGGWRELRGLEFDLCSVGPDGIEFTPDDICYDDC